MQYAIAAAFLARAETLIHAVAGLADRGRMDQAEMVP